MHCTETWPVALLNTLYVHDDVIWKHFLYYRSFMIGIHRSPADSPHKGPVIQSFGYFFADSLTSCWTTSRVVDEFRCSCNVTVMNYDGNFMFVIAVHPIIMHPVRASIYFFRGLLLADVSRILGVTPLSLRQSYKPDKYTVKSVI